MGSKSGQTIGFWYYWLLHLGLWRGPIDALLEWRYGDRTAWSGEVTASGTISIDQENLLGGEKGEGGVVGDADIMLGEGTQAPNAYLIANGGAFQPGYRGKTSFLFKGGKLTAFNPYLKGSSFKGRRIYAGWQSDAGTDCWYSAKAGILMETNDPATLVSGEVALNALTNSDVGPSHSIDFSGFSPQDVLRVTFPGGQTYTAWQYVAGVSPWYTDFSWTGNRDGLEHRETLTGQASAAAALALRQLTGPVFISGHDSYKFWLFDTLTTDNVGGVSFKVEKLVGAFMAMNPAHIIYDAKTATDMQGEPTATINVASFQAAADQLYSEGFGLCTEYDADRETIDQFIERICTIIGASCSRSRTDGTWHLDLIRGNYVLADLPILTDADIIDFREIPATTEDAPNQVSVKWLDPQRKETRTTIPATALASVREFGFRSLTLDWDEVPVERLARQLGDRELRNRQTPLKRYELVTNRKLYASRTGTYFRLQSTKRGIADMVCQIVEIDAGTLRSGALRIVAMQEISGFSNTTYVGSTPEPLPPSVTPEPTPHQMAIEVPYFELAARLSAPDLAAVAAETGYLGLLAERPETNATNFSLYTAADGEAYADRGAGDWCPTATLVEAAGYTTTAFTLANGVDLGEVAVDQAIVWDDASGEIGRVDSVNLTTGAISIARGCADTVPAIHSAGARVFFLGADAATDGREYLDGELVHAKALTRMPGGELALADATAADVTMAGRQFRPYPPADLKFNGARYPDHFDGALSLSWVDRNRVTQADQLVGTTEASIAKEAGTTYRLRLYNGGGVLFVDTTVSGTSYTWSTETSVDPSAAFVVSHLQFQGDDGSTTFTDLTGKVWTPAAGAHIVADPDAAGGASGAFIGGARITTPNHADFNFGTGDFNVRARIRLAALGTNQAIASNYQDSSNGWTLEVDTTGHPFFNATGDVADITSSVAIAVDTEALVEIDRFGTSLKLFIDGTVVASTTNSDNISSTAVCSIGALAAFPSLSGLNGNVLEVEVTKGESRHQANYTPDPPPFPPGLGTLNAAVRVRLEAMRDGVSSWQEHDITIPRAGYGFAYGYWYGG